MHIADILGWCGNGQLLAGALSDKYKTDGYSNVDGTRGISTEKEIAQSGIILKTYPVQVSTDTDVTTNVLRDMRNVARTTNYGFIVGSHGSGWLRNINVTRSVGVDN